MKICLNKNTSGSCCSCEYMSAGWVSQDISYNPGCVPQEKGRNDDSASSLATSSSTPEKNSSKATHLGPKRKKALVEST